MESNWFVGADHINEIEGRNSDIRKTKVLRDKQKLRAFIQNAIFIVQDWSKKDDSKNTDKSSIVKLKEKYYTLSSKAPEDLDLKADLKKFLKYKKDFDYPDGFDEWKIYIASSI